MINPFSVYRMIAIKKSLKRLGWSGAAVARQLDKSPSTINSILRGEYPYTNAFEMPRYFYEFVKQNKLDEETN